MIILETEQGSPEWMTARMGIPTASQFDRIVTPGGKASSAQRKYLAELCAEWALGEPASEFQGTAWTDRGHVLEDEARRFFAFERDCEYRQVGLVYRDDARTVAASPDGIVEGRGPLELKCPMPKTHLLWLSDGELPREHVIQVQGQMWIMGADVGDFFSYCPSLPPLLISVVADIKLHDAFNEHIPAFCAELAERKRRLIDMGVEPWGVPPGQEGREREKPWWEDGSEPATGSAAPATKPERRATPVADVDAWLTEYDAAQGESHE